MGREPSPVFLERGSYRRRRVMDAVRLIVVLGVGLWMVPLLWPSTNEEGVEPISMSVALFYVFGVWLLLILASAVLVSLLSLGRRDDEQEEASK